MSKTSLNKISLIKQLVDKHRHDPATITKTVATALAQAEQAQQKHNAWLAIFAEQAQQRAASLAELSPEERGKLPLYGVPLAVKDNLCWTGEPTTCGSKLLEGYVPSYTATVVERLEQAGAVVIGKTNLDEFAYGSSNETSAFGAVTNPFDETRTPGGSSGGSAVAAGGVLLALGSDTGGSVRQPAAFCGVYGLKPTYGRLSRYGLVAFASSMDQIGLFSNHPTDLRLALAVSSGADSHDATSAEIPEKLPAGFDPKNATIGVIKEFQQEEGLQPKVAEAFTKLCDTLEKLGCRIKEISLPAIVHSTAVYMLTAMAEASTNLSRFDGVNYGNRRMSLPNDTDAVFTEDDDALLRMYAGTRGAGFGDEVKRRIMLGTFALAEGYYDAYYLRAQKVRTLIRQQFDAAFEEVDLIISPTTPTTAFRLGEKSDDPVAMYLADMFTNPANEAGICALNIPWGSDDAELPIGMQLMAPAFAEERLIQAAEQLHEVHGSFFYDAVLGLYL